MSYCRWSSDNFNCDLYCYEHVGGWFDINVANNRHRLWFRFFHWLTDRRLKIRPGVVYNSPRFQTWHWPLWLTHKKIGLPQDGAHIMEKTEEEMFKTIRWLHRMGYRVPQHLLEEINQALK